MTEKLSILLIEDDYYFANRVGKFLGQFGEVTYASHLNQALATLKGSKFQIVVTDLNLTKDETKEGLLILKKAKELGIYTIILSSYDDLKTTREAYEAGCDHFLVKAYYEESLGPYLEQFYLRGKLDYWKEQLGKNFITKDKGLTRDLKNLLTLNLKNKCLFISGETGVGKTYLAKLLHKAVYENKNFISFNCSQVPESLIDSELFGHEKGAFTGATSSYDGLLKRANEGTLFLDEIATMPIYTQQKLLKAIEEKEFSPLGSKKTVKVNFTLISATCEDIQNKIKEGTFRRDLYFRVAGFELYIPPLRERPEDIELQIYHFLSKSPRRFFIEESVIEELKNYYWPGNTRELQKLIENFSALNQGIIKSGNSLIPKSNHISQKGSLLTQRQKDLILEVGLKRFIGSIEKEMVKEVYFSENGKKTNCIQKLGLSNSAFYRIFKEVEHRT